MRHAASKVTKEGIARWIAPYLEDKPEGVFDTGAFDLDCYVENGPHSDRFFLVVRR